MRRPEPVRRPARAAAADSLLDRRLPDLRTQATRLDRLSSCAAMTIPNGVLLEDAKAAGQVLLAAQEVTGLSVEDWLVRVGWTLDGQLRKHGGYGKPVKQDGNPDGPLYGEVIAFTGALMVPRHDAVARAAEAGCRVADAVSKKVTLLVVGDQDVAKLAEGQTRSTKHRKAEELIAAGHPLRILRETDFVELVRLD